MMQWGAENCPEEVKDQFTTPLPFPFLLLVTGYTLILIIDKVLFDTHAILGHDDDHDGAASQLRKSVASIIRQSQVDGGKLSGVGLENALRQSMGSLKRNEIFAAKLSQNKAQQEEYESNKNADIVVLREDKDDDNQLSLPS